MGSLGGRGKGLGYKSLVLVDEVVEGDGVKEGLRGKVGFGTDRCGDLSTTPRVFRALLGVLWHSTACGGRSRLERCCKVVGRSGGLEVVVWNVRGGGRGPLGIPASRSRS